MFFVPICLLVNAIREWIRIAGIWSKTKVLKFWSYGGASGTHQGITKASGICPLGIIIICAKFLGNPFSSCWDIPVWIKVEDRLTDCHTDIAIETTLTTAPSLVCSYHADLISKCNCLLKCCSLYTQCTHRWWWTTHFCPRTPIGCNLAMNNWLTSTGCDPTGIRTTKTWEVISIILIRWSVRWTETHN